MAAKNENPTTGKKFYKLKEEKLKVEFKGEYRFFEQVKVNEKWCDGETFNCLEGTVTGIEVKEYEYEGKPKKALVVKLHDGVSELNFTLGLNSSGAQQILNTLAGNNPLKLSFKCGVPKEKNGKSYPSLYINKDGATNEDKRTQWKYAPTETPRITSTTDDDGNVIKKGVKAADEFWLKVVKEVQDKIAAQPVQSTGAQGFKNNTDFDNQKAAQVTGNSNQDDIDLPF